MLERAECMPSSTFSYKETSESDDDDYFSTQAPTEEQTVSATLEETSLTTETQAPPVDYMSIIQSAIETVKGSVQNYATNFNKFVDFFKIYSAGFDVNMKLEMENDKNVAMKSKRSLKEGQSSENGGEKNDDDDDEDDDEDESAVQTDDEDDDEDDDEKNNGNATN